MDHTWGRSPLWTATPILDLFFRDDFPPPHSLFHFLYFLTEVLLSKLPLGFFILERFQTTNFDLRPSTYLCFESPGGGESSRQ